jgi:hypothetical protein
MRKIKEIIIVLAAIVTIITGIGYINLACVKNLFEKILEHKLIVVIVIAIIIIVFLFVKFSSIIFNFFKWLSIIYFKFIWKIIGLEKRLEEENTKWEVKFEKIKIQIEIQKNELTKIQEKIWKAAGNDGEGLKFYLENCSSANVLITIRSKTFKKTGKGYECNYDDYEKFHNAINRFDKNVFEITAFGRTLDIPYEKLNYWMLDELEHNENNPNKIHLYLKKDVAIVLYPGEKLKLVNYNEISQFIT